MRAQGQPQGLPQTHHAPVLRTSRCMSVRGYENSAGGACTQPTTERRHTVAATHWWSWRGKLYPRWRRARRRARGEEEGGWFIQSNCSERAGAATERPSANSGPRVQIHGEISRGGGVHVICFGNNQPFPSRQGPPFSSEKCS